jgi:hypothetical protein
MPRGLAVRSDPQFKLAYYRLAGVLARYVRARCRSQTETCPPLARGGRAGKRERSHRDRQRYSVLQCQGFRHRATPTPRSCRPRAASGIEELTPVGVPTATASYSIRFGFSQFAPVPCVQFFEPIRVSASSITSLLGLRHLPAYADVISRPIDFGRSRANLPVWLIGTSQRSTAAVNSAPQLPTAVRRVRAAAPDQTARSRSGASRDFRIWLVKAALRPGGFLHMGAQ